MNIQKILVSNQKFNFYQIRTKVPKVFKIKINFKKDIIRLQI